MTPISVVVSSCPLTGRLSASSLQRFMATGVLKLEAEAQSLLFWLTLLFLFPYPLQALPFSHLILATGSTGPFPGKCNEVSCQQAAIQAYEDMVKQVCHTDGCESARGHSRGSGREIVRGHQCWITSLGGSKSCYSEILSELLCVLCWCITHRLVSPVTSG